MPGINVRMKGPSYDFSIELHSHYTIIEGVDSGEGFTDYLHSIILENPVAWYTAEAGVTALDIMLGDLEKIY